MRTCFLPFHLFFCAAVHAQYTMNVIPGTAMTCQVGYTPSITCNNPTPEMCTCTCGDGAMFNQSRPGNAAPPPPAVEPPHQLPAEPCTADIIIPWTEIRLPHVVNSYEPSDMYSHSVELEEDSVFVVADSVNRCQHFQVFVDGVEVGQTDGTMPLDNFNCGTPEDCIKLHGGSHGYFTIPKGQHTIGLRWIRITDACKHIPVGYGSYQIYKKC